MDTLRLWTGDDNGDRGWQVELMLETGRLGTRNDNGDCGCEKTTKEIERLGTGDENEDLAAGD